MGFGWYERLKKGKVFKKCEPISKVGLGGMDDGKSESRTELQIISKVGLGGIRWDEWLKNWKYYRSAFFQSGIGWDGWLKKCESNRTEKGKFMIRVG